MTGYNGNGTHGTPLTFECVGVGDLQTHIGETGKLVCIGCGLENPPLDDSGYVAKHAPVHAPVVPLMSSEER